MIRPAFRLGFGMLSTLGVAFAVACGGGAAATKDGAGANTPGSSGAPTEAASGPGASSSSSSGGGAGSGSGSGAASTSGGTTTTQLGDGGDLQGARLGGKLHTETETKGESGPASTKGQSAGEPGRGVKDIQAIVGSRRDEARACYDKALGSHPGIQGDLDVKWVIDRDGNVTDASVDTSRSTILEPSVGNCIVDVIKKIKFAGSAKGYETRAHYPFNFHPRRDGGR